MSTTFFLLEAFAPLAIFIFGAAITVWAAVDGSRTPDYIWEAANKSRTGSMVWIVLFGAFAAILYFLVTRRALKRADGANNYAR